jgi:hypothetical protein
MVYIALFSLSAMCLHTSILREAFQDGPDFLSILQANRIRKADGFNAELTSGID